MMASCRRSGSTADGVELPGSVHAFECVLALILELETGPGDKVADGS